MAVVIAAGLYDIWITRTIVARFWVALGISGVSLLLAVPPALRTK
jgi:hypothetical protein